MKIRNIQSTQSKIQFLTSLLIASQCSNSTQTFAVRESLIIKENIQQVQICGKEYPMIALGTLCPAGEKVCSCIPLSKLSGSGNISE